MSFSSLGKIGAQVIVQGVHGRVVSGERLTFVVVELDPGAIVPRHAHENEQLGVLARGSMRFRIGDEERDLGPGDTWSIPSNAEHEVIAGPDGAVAIEVFAPARTDWDTLESLAPATPSWPAP